MIAPWLQPPNFLGFSTAGAEAGLSASRIAQAGQQSAAHIALAGQQLAAENERAKEANSTRQQDMLASLLERSQTAQLMKQYHDADIAERNRHNLATEGKPGPDSSKYWHVGNQIVYRAPDGTIKVGFSANDNGKNAADKLASQTVMQNLKHEQGRYDKANQHLSKKDLDPEESLFWKGEMTDAKQKIADYNRRLDPNAPVAATPDVPLSNNPFNFPTGLSDFKSNLFGPADPTALNPIPAATAQAPVSAPTYEYEWKDGKAVKPGAE